MRPGDLEIGEQRSAGLAGHRRAPIGVHNLRYTVHRDDLPVSCPLPSMALWNSHPRVYLAIEDAPGGDVQCPYCGAHFVLAD